MKQSVLAFLITVICGFVIVGSLNFGATQTGTNVKGIISSDTTWTRAQSPYNFTGPVAIENNITLTVEPGVTINLNSYYIRVNGTLVAIGNEANPIQFEGGEIEFTESSTSRNAQTGVGSIIENAAVNSQVSIGSSSPSINNNKIEKIIGISGGSPLIFKNIINVNAGSDSLGRPVFDPFAIDLVGNNSANISDNVISGDFNEATIKIEGGSPIIERNVISNNYGFNGIGYQQSAILVGRNTNPLVQNNTITKNAVGISLSGSSSPTIICNNIQNNSNYNIFLGSSVKNDVNATDNWWGTTDAQAINRSIYDFKNDFNLGTVNFVSFLTTPNPHAMPDPNASPPTSMPAPSPLPSSSVPEMTSLAAIITVASVTCLVALSIKKRSGTSNKTSLFQKV